MAINAAGRRMGDEVGTAELASSTNKELDSEGWATAFLEKLG